jgi:hypothetical protein
MATKVSYTADATSDVLGRLEKAVQDAQKTISPDRLKQLSEVQKKVEDLSRRGLLKRQEYAAATTADFQKLFMHKG